MALDLPKPDAGLYGIKVSVVYGMGDPLKPYGEMACVWEAVESHGGHENAWETAPAYGEAAKPYGEPKITSKPEILKRWRPAGFACFHEFLAGGGGPAFATVKAPRGACCERRGA